MKKSRKLKILKKNCFFLHFNVETLDVYDKKQKRDLL
tara:strand:- start:130 stop:240 length:111 start_codon:yes stop_codon:yes gene_type:complete